MNHYYLIKMATHSISHHLHRTCMTMLGIIIGIISLLMLESIGTATRKKIDAQLKALGENYLYIQAHNNQTKKTSRNSPIDLTIQDMTTLLKMLPESIKHASPFLVNTLTIKTPVGGMTIATPIKAGNHHLLAIMKRSLSQGYPINPDHVTRSAKVIIIGADLAQSLFPHESAINKIIIINNIPYTIIGVIAKINHFLSNDNPNNDAFIPYTTMHKYHLNTHKKSTHKIKALIISLNEDAPRQAVQEKIISILHTRRKQISPHDYHLSVYDVASSLKASHHATSTLNTFLLIITIIALIIGGMSVMNTMLITVNERRQEIGIRLAIGATPRMIQQQFLYEAIMICAGGGIIGSLMGCGGICIMHIMSSFPTTVSFSTLILAFTLIIMIGIIFGYYPARKASELNPANILTSE